MIDHLSDEFLMIYKTILPESIPAALKKKCLNFQPIVYDWSELDEINTLNWWILVDQGDLGFFAQKLGSYSLQRQHLVYLSFLGFMLIMLILPRKIWTSMLIKQNIAWLIN